MGFLSITKIGKKFALTPAKAKDILIRNGLFNLKTATCKGGPSDQAFTGKFAEMRDLKEDVYKDTNIDEVKEYVVWDLDKVAPFFKPPTELQLFSMMTRYTADHRFCALIVRVSEALNIPEEFDLRKIDVNPDLRAWMEKYQLSPATLIAIEECSFNDAHFIGGPVALLVVDSVSGVETIFKKILPVKKELLRALHLAGNLEELVDFFTDALNEIEKWALRQVTR